MSTFGEDLRMERLSRGIALEEISAVTKISGRHLEALEQERFRVLPGGIINKGIVRGYACAVGLNPGHWTERFLQAYIASGAMLEEERDWIAFASNVGKQRMQHPNTMGIRLRWIGLLLLVLMTAAGVWLGMRYF